MSQNRASNDARGRLSKTDCFVSLALHISIPVALLLLQFLSPTQHIEVIPSMQVATISEAQLQQILKKTPEAVEPKPVEPEPVEPEPVEPEPVEPEPVEPEPVEPEPVEPEPVEPESVEPEPQLIPKPITKPKVKENDNPFAAAISKSNKPKTNTRPTQAQVKQAIAQMSSMEYENYLSRMVGAVQREWKVAANMQHRALPVVLMELKRSGHILKAKIIRSSGNRRLDDSLLRAIYAAAPFAVPRKQFNAFASNEITFHPEQN